MKLIKYTHHILLVILLSSLLGCNKSETLGLEIELKGETSLLAEGGHLKMVVSAEEKWDISTPEWIVPNVNIGKGRTLVTFKIQPNFSKDVREGEITFTTSTGSKSITIKQEHGDLSIEEIKYDLPIIFHILYNKDSIRHQITEDTIQMLMDRVNALYRGAPEEMDPEFRGIQKYRFPDLNLSFSLATTSPDGKKLKEKGINRVEITENELNYNTVINDVKGGKFWQMKWDIKQYINIFIFRFAPMREGNKITGTVLGVATMPYQERGMSIEGLVEYNEEVLSTYNHCIAINNDRISNTRKGFDGYDLSIQSDGATTIAHELGHYLGLFHVFGEKDTEEGVAMVNDCTDSDYCSDTYSYDRVSYSELLKRRFATGGALSLEEIVGFLNRTNCNGSRFISDNIMDYEFSKSFRFTDQQRERIRQCLYYSPVIPGIKLNSTRSTPSSSQDTTRSRPRIVVCETPNTSHQCDHQ